MKLWLLQVKTPRMPDDPWTPWYDKSFGFVVRAVDEAEARQIADRNSGDESRKMKPWLDERYSTCEQLTSHGSIGLILNDYRSA